MLIKLHPTTPWRIGPDSGDRDRVDRIYHSDSLYSAVSSAMARLGILDEWLDATARVPTPPVRVGIPASETDAPAPPVRVGDSVSAGIPFTPAVRFSSCFPFQGDVSFIVPPRSLWPPPASPKVRWRGAKFVPLSVVNELVTSRSISEEGWTVDPASECLIPIGTSGGISGAASGPFRVSVRSSAAVDRHGSGVFPHSTACIEFAPNSGLWAAAAFADDAAREKWAAPLQGAIRLLADSGFGGERSRGWGRAEVSFSDDPLPFVSWGSAMRCPPDDKASPPSADCAWWMLSLFHPASGDSIDWGRGSYSLTTRGGRVESPVSWGDAKKPTRMIAEGSVIVAAAEPRGSASNVAPDDFPHPVYRAGFALAVPIPLGPAERRDRMERVIIPPGPSA
jgi:CRISPR type III-A-associated RAMP protein Csm4